MKIKPDIFKYLSGENFKSNLIFNLEREKQKAVSRESAVISLVKDKRVIHIGCSDHIEIIEDKLRQNLWLHKLITEISSECIGIDIDRESIEFIKNKLHFTNVYQGDILIDDFAVIKEKNWDYVLFGEVLEHLDNPVVFLKTFKAKYGKYVNRFIISVPNIYSMHHFKNMKKYIEQINSDHRFWFTPYTISRVLMSAGFRPEEISFTNHQPLTFVELIIRKLKMIAGFGEAYPFYYFRTLIITGTLS